MNSFLSLFSRAKSYVYSSAFEARKQSLIQFAIEAQKVIGYTDAADFLAPLFIRIYLAPVFWMGGVNKFTHFQATADWFGNALGFPVPYVMVLLVASVELFGGVLLLFGLAVRWITIPLMIAMLVAAVSVHWRYGWLAIAAGSGLFATERTVGAVERLEKARQILQQYGDYASLTENGAFVVLNNGIEFAATYFILLLVLFFTGGGRYVGADYWIARRYMGK